MPPTRYQGSKRRIMDWIGRRLAGLEFETVLDAFGGSGVVSHWLKVAGKAVTYNDVLHFNHEIGTALVENHGAYLDPEEMAWITMPAPDRRYEDFIGRTFRGIYFTDEENRWLDVAAQNIAGLTCRFKRSLAWYALFQSAIAKRPYNLFHRKNLYLRLADVPRGFGNKATWDRAFEVHFREHTSRANAAVFAGRRPCRAVRGDALMLEGEFDLVYIDPPYVSGRGVGVDYLAFYHFLEGLVCYNEWPGLIDPKSKHRAMRRAPSPWTSAGQVHGAFATLLGRFEKSILAVSYRSDGIPSAEELVALIRRVKGRVAVHEDDRYRYALSTNKRSRELLIVGTG